MDSALSWIMIAVLGAILGSFFNVLIYRIPRDISIILPRSSCPHCHHVLSWYENIPILSYIGLRGKCRKCRSPIPLRYVIVETITPCALCISYVRHGYTAPFFVEFSFFCLLILVTFTDLETYLIPDVYSLGGMLAGLCLSGFNPLVTWQESLLGILLGAGVLMLIAQSYKKLRGQEGMGMGDIKFLGMIGAFTGWEGIIIALFFSAISGLLVGFIVMMIKKEGLKTMLPYGPFLALGAFIADVWGKQIIELYIHLGLY